MTSQEKTVPWGLVVEGDQIYSAKTGKWYTVTGSCSIKGTDKVKIFAKGIPKAFERDAGEKTTVRRGLTGEAVDVIALVFSAQTMPETRES